VLLHRFFGVEPPAFLVLSATLHLPLPVYPAGPAERLQLARQLRDLHFNPQRHLTDGTAADPRARELVGRKQALAAAAPTDRVGRRQRFHDLRAVTEELHGFVQEQEESLRHRLGQLEQELQENALRQRRDYAFCLFPEAKLRPFCEQFLFRESLCR